MISAKMRIVLSNLKKESRRISELKKRSIEAIDKESVCVEVILSYLD
jgi:hypothetical protein